MDAPESVNKPVFVIGLGYKKQSGKTTLARHMVRFLNDAGIPACSYAFAAPLKTFLGHAYGVPWRVLNGTDEEKEQLCGVNGWTVRELMQNVGMALRDGVPSVFSGALERRDWGECKVVVVHDVRFYDEVQAIRRLGGITVRVDRDHEGSEDDHRSERELDSFTGWDYSFANDGDLDDLPGAVARFMTEFVLDDHLHKIPR